MSSCALLNLPDDLILHILTFLKSWDLLNVIDTCQRLSKIGKDRTLWIDVDLTDGSLSVSKLSRSVLCCLQLCTKRLCLKGHKKKFKWKTDNLTPSVLLNISKKCPNLDEFLLMEAIVDAKKVKIRDVGLLKTITNLSFLSCEIINLPSPVPDGSYFKNMNSYFPSLRNLSITNSSWITDYDLMVLSKLDSLKELTLRSNMRIGVTIAYLAISFRFGFKNLQFLDIRGTSLQNYDVPCIVQNDKLRTLLIGPIGSVRRISAGSEDGLSLVMPDPQRRHEPQQQVVVVNMGAEGLQWRQAEVEELDCMGLQWVKQGLKKSVKPESSSNVEEDEHYFIGKEGHVLNGDEDLREGRKRKRSEECENVVNKKVLLDCKKTTSKNCDNQVSGIEEPSLGNNYSSDVDWSSSDDEIYGEEETSNIANKFNDEICTPDEFLSDLLVCTFGDHTSKLEHLGIAGCAVTDYGFKNIMGLIPTLKSIDLSGTLITSIAVEAARITHPKCKYVMDKNPFSMKPS